MRITCKCGQEFKSRKALGAHIKSERRRVDISSQHSAAKKDPPIRPVEELYAAE